MKFRRDFLLTLFVLLGLAVVCACAQEAGEKPADAPALKQAPEEVPAADEAATTGEETGQPPAEGEDVDSGQRKSPFGSDWLLPVMIGAIVLMLVFSSRSRRKKESKRKEMLSSLKKGDKITSIGGICGTVIEVREDEVIVKVDEGNNVRMRFARWSIRGVGEDAKIHMPGEKR